MSAAARASNFASQAVGSAGADVLKEPLGFIKIIEFVRHHLLVAESTG